MASTTIDAGQPQNVIGGVIKSGGDLSGISESPLGGMNNYGTFTSASIAGLGGQFISGSTVGDVGDQITLVDGVLGNKIEHKDDNKRTSYYSLPNSDPSSMMELTVFFDSNGNLRNYIDGSIVKYSSITSSNTDFGADNSNRYAVSIGALPGTGVYA